VFGLPPSSRQIFGMSSNKNWPISQLVNLVKHSPQAGAPVVQFLKNSCPETYQQLAILALDSGEISLAEVAKELGIPESTVANLYENYVREQSSERRNISKLDGVAILTSCRVAVWEVEREYRRAGSIEALESLFPGIPPRELRCAIKYAAANSEEVEAQISRFETSRNYLAYIN
jgi:uncharacterized protein (DUF433 family)